MKVLVFIVELSNSFLMAMEDVLACISVAFAQRK